MKMLFLSPELLTIGGMQRQNRLMIAALDRYASIRGGAVTVLSLNDRPLTLLPSELSALKATSLRFFSRSRKSFVWNAGLRMPRATLVIYGFLGFAPLIALQVTLNAGARGLLQIHGREAWEFRSRLHAWAVRRMGGFISVSQYTLDVFREVYRVSAGSAGFVIPNPVSPEFLRAAESSNLPAEHDSPRLLSVTRLDITDQPKGVDTVIRALPALLQEFPQLLYVVVGDGVDRMRLERLTKDLGVMTAVRFLGFVPDEVLKREYARCTLFVLPSAKEGFGFVFIEAMAYGKPVVAARARAVPEVVEHGRTGLLVEYGNVSQLAEAVSCLLKDGALRRQIGASARGTVQERYTFDAFCGRVFSVLDSYALG